MIENVDWLGHASFRIQGPPLIYIDPWRVTREETSADVILISHDHYDHCSPADVDKLRGPNTVVIASLSAGKILNDAKILRPWQSVNVGRVCIRTVPAYNRYHPTEAEGLGFIISLGMYDIYYAGDTDLIPEMGKFNPDLAILPIGGKQTMSAEDAVAAVKQMRPRWVIPSHWGTGGEGGSIIDLKTFTRGVEGLTEVVMPERVR